MLTLCSLNIEGDRHYNLLLPYLEKTRPDCLCLMEAPAALVNILFRRGYFVTFAPMTYDNPVAHYDTLGLLFATRVPHDAITHYYTSHHQTPYPHDKHDSHSKSYPVIVGTTSKDGTPYTIATVHTFDTYDGLSNQAQADSFTSLLSYLATLPPHVLCGDFNMPRGYNTNYERFTAHYTDTIPPHYTSSLDRTLHRAGARTDLNAPIFDIYMVDYLFTQSPYQAQNVHLAFNLSDHAAVVAEISRL